MTKLLYQTDGYLREFDAEIISLDAENRALGLDRTAFYPGGGGQPHDLGTLIVAGIEYPVARLKKQGDDIFHYIGDSSGNPTTLPPLGSAVHGVIDWDRRYKLMRTHTAMHILCGVVFRDYGALVTGGDMEPLKGRMDFEFETMHGELVREIEVSINKEVVNARDVHIKILPREEAFIIPDLIRTKINLLPGGITQVRTVEIVGLDLQADGGTHVMNTSEVGKLRVVDYKSKGAINKRIYVEVG
jgi:misacylated tRNA(Ala) deacylase